MTQVDFDWEADEYEDGHILQAINGGCQQDE